MAKASQDDSERLFIDSSGQRRIFGKSLQQQLEDDSGSVECFGKRFESEAAMREHYLCRLRESLKDPNFRKIDGFPVADDATILAVADPPFYTPCPNPFLVDIATAQDDGNKAADAEYQREPFAADVSEGKADPIYNSHSYHTKVPHKAIMRYILHYTSPGDLVLDGFCGTGMTGVAAALCDNRAAVEELGYTILRGGAIADKDGHTFSRLGGRRCVLNDLSPAATLIAAGYGLGDEVATFVPEAKRILAEFEKTYGWMYETQDPKSGKTGHIDFTVWSEVFSCPECSKEFVFWDVAYDRKTGEVATSFECPHCKAELGKRDLTRATEAFVDPALNVSRRRTKLRPVLIHYTVGGSDKTKVPDASDLEVLAKVERELKNVSFPSQPMMLEKDRAEWGDLWRGYHEGITHVHDFCLTRQLLCASLLWGMRSQLKSHRHQVLWRYLLQSVMVSFTRRNRYRKKAYSQVNTNLSGTLYVGSTVSEPSPQYLLTGKLKRMGGALPEVGAWRPVVTTGSLTDLRLPDNSVDYIFVDPPFGDNLPYSELNFLWEAWLGVVTARRSEAIVSGVAEKGLPEYSALMVRCFRELHRVLKPGRWVTVEFHNSKNSVWASIQDALGLAGFVIADVRVLDKGMLTKKQSGGANAVNKDLIISAYKPEFSFEGRFKLEAGTEDGAWDFLRTHLRKLPVYVGSDGDQAELIPERMTHLLFDRMVAFHVQRGIGVPLSAGDFYVGLAQRFPERDGMFFLPDQAAEYDRKRQRAAGVKQLQLFVTDEETAIQWIRQQLAEKPQTFKELQPQFMKEIAGWEKHERPLELLDLLRQNFICYDGNGQVPNQIHAYLSSNFKELRNLSKSDASLREKATDRWYVPDPNKAGDLEKLRERALLAEFEEYKASKQRTLKVFRTEAVRAGFKAAYDRQDYKTIVTVAEKLPETVLQEDEKLLMYHDVATMRLGDADKDKLFQ